MFYLAEHVFYNVCNVLLGTKVVLFSKAHAVYITLNTDCQDTYWVFELVVMVASKYLSCILQHYTSEETCLSTFQSPIDPGTILGGFPGNNFTEVMFY